jgi:glycosyltransferase involved in cell wall biosynthesis
VASPQGRPGPVVLDLQAVQSADHRGRGVARYAYELAVQLVRSRPDLVGRVLLNPALPPPGEIEPLVVSGLLAHAGSPDALPDGARIFHSLSPFELHTPIEQVWPRVVSQRGLLLAATVYDLIPELLADHYLREPGQRRRYRSRLQLLRCADHLLAISASAGADVSARLELPAGSVSVVGTGTSPHFAPPASRAAALARARAEVPGLEAEFVVYPGGTDFRKNVEGLIRGYALLPPATRGRYQLVVACQMGAQPLAHYSYVCRLLGIEERVLLTGFVSDDALLHLYQSASLFVFPSLAEGYGLPVAEAVACGAPVIGSQIPALEELLAADQLFDPTSAETIADALESALRDDRLAELAGRAGKPPATWAEVAERTARVYETMLERPPHPWRRRRAVGFVTPLPPAPTGIAHHSLRLTEELARLGEFDVDTFADGLDREPYEPVAPAGAGCFSARSLPAIEALRGGYDEVVYALGNSDNHVTGLAQLRRRPGVVIAHDVRLTNLYTFGAKDPAAVPGGLAASIERVYGGRLPRQLGRSGRVSDAEQEQYGLLLAREVIGLATRYVVSSDAARALALLDAAAGAPGSAGDLAETAAKIALLPISAEPPTAGRSGFEERPGVDDVFPPEGAGTEGAPLVVTLGIVHEVRQPRRLLDAFATVRERHPSARLAYVGPAPDDLAERLRARAEELGLADAVTVTGQVGTACFLAWLRQATVAVQLRERWNGESSATIGECLVSGAAVVVSDLGWMHELPDACVVKVSPAAPAAELGAELAALLVDAPRLAALRAAALELAPELSFARAAERLAALIFGAPPGPHGAEGQSREAVPPEGDVSAGRLPAARKSRRTGSRNAGRS